MRAMVLVCCLVIFIVSLVDCSVLAYIFNSKVSRWETLFCKDIADKFVEANFEVQFGMLSVFIECQRLL